MHMPGALVGYSRRFRIVILISFAVIVVTPQKAEPIIMPAQIASAAAAPGFELARRSSPANAAQNNMPLLMLHAYPHDAIAPYSLCRMIVPTDNKITKTELTCHGSRQGQNAHTIAVKSNQIRNSAMENCGRLQIT
jgi:hypothetical protein